MATNKGTLKPSKWFSNKSLRLSLHRRRSSSSSNLTLSSPSSPICTTPKNNSNDNNNNSIGEDEVREVFRHFDRDGDGKISAYELRSYFGSVGEHLSHEEAQKVINDLDSDGDSFLNLKDFAKVMKRDSEDGDEEDLKKAFEMFVWEKGSGCITPTGLQHMFHRLGDEKSLDECVAMIEAFDIDHNGVLDFNEFQQMMMA